MTACCFIKQILYFAFFGIINKLMRYYIKLTFTLSLPITLPRKFLLKFLSQSTRFNEFFNWTIPFL